MKFLNKLKEVTLSLLPVVAICLFVHFFISPFETRVIVNFIIAVGIIIVGEALFFLGVDAAIIPMGEIVGNSSNKGSKFFVLVIFGFIFGLFATIAEPDVSVLAGQAVGIGVGIGRLTFIFLIGAGVGVCVALALMRIATGVPFKAVLATICVTILVLCMFVPNSLVALSFDAGGATTGIITSPFLIAIASGISTKKSKRGEDNSFGVIGIASLGPVLALLLYFLIKRTAGVVGGAAAEATSTIGQIIGGQLEATSLSILPLMLFFFVYELIFVKLPKKKVGALLFGGLVTFVGLFMFLFAIEFGFIEMGRALGTFLSTKSAAIVIIFSVVLGFIITFTEPAVMILGSQIEDVTGGHIKAKTVLISIAISMALAVGLSALRIVFNINFVYIVAAGYAVALILMLFSSSSFTAIGFDSGGVASGPITAAFILPLMLGLADGAEGFGVIALVGLMPIIVLQVLGIVYQVQLKSIARKRQKQALRIAYEMEMLSNIDALKKESLRARRKKEKQGETD